MIVVIDPTRVLTGDVLDKKVRKGMSDLIPGLVLINKYDLRPLPKTRLTPCTTINQPVRRQYQPSGIEQGSRVFGRENQGETQTKSYGPEYRFGGPLCKHPKISVGETFQQASQIP